MCLIKRIFVGVLVVGFLWLAGFVAFSFSALRAEAGHGDKTADAIVVLTGGTDRIARGLALFASGRAAHLFISGVHPDVKKSEIITQWTGDTALPPCCITLGRQATTTIENAVETKDWAQEYDIQSMFLVTSNYHMKRAKGEIQAVLPEVDVYPYPIAQNDLNIGSARIWELLFSEYHKFLLRWVQLLFF